MFHGKLPQHARTAYCTPTCARVRAYAWARTDDASGKPTQFWNEIHCTCARDNIYQAPVLLVGGPGNEAKEMVVYTCRRDGMTTLPPEGGVVHLTSCHVVWSLREYMTSSFINSLPPYVCTPCPINSSHVHVHVHIRTVVTGWLPLSPSPLPPSFPPYYTLSTPLPSHPVLR